MLDRAQDLFRDEILVVAPHIDSDCGVLEGLKDHGQARISVLNHSALAALSFIKEETREYLKRLALNQVTVDYVISPPFRRLIFMGKKDQRSENSGQRSEFRAARQRLTPIRKAFGEREHVKCSVDFTKAEYDAAILGEYRQSFSAKAGQPRFQESDADAVATAICGMENSDGGIIDLEINAPANEIQADLDFPALGWHVEDPH